MSKRFRLVIFVAGAILCLFGFLWYSLVPLSFDETRWKEAREKGDTSVLYRMSDSLRKKLVSDKPSPKQVTELLGPPERDGSFFYQYSLGRHRTLSLLSSLDHWWLSVEFENNQVSKVRINPE